MVALGGRAALLSAALLASVVTANAVQAAGGRQVSVRSTLHATEDAVPDTSICTGPGHEYAPGPLDSPYSGSSTYTGTFDGVGRFCGYIIPAVHSDGSVPFVETDIFTGHVKGCGVGSVTYTVRGTVDAVFDAGRHAFPAQEDWTILRGSGTKDLKNVVSGGGHDPAQINVDTSIDADFLGAVWCAGRRR